MKSKHLQEWLASAVSSDLARFNVRSLDGDEIYDYLCTSPDLPRTNTGILTSAILKRYKHCTEGGWWASGIDPLTWGEMVWGCFKPDRPKTGFAKGKPIKYEHPPKQSTRAFFLYVPDEIWELISQRYSVPISAEDRQHPGQFWHWVWARGIPLVITEGAKKAAALLTAGFAAIALPGIFSGYRTERNNGRFIGRALILDLAKFATLGREVFFAFDQDSKPKTRQAVQTAIKNTGGLFASAGCQVKVIEWPLGTLKGVDDFLAAKGREAFERLTQAALTLDTYTASLLWQLSYRPDLKLNQRYLGALPFPTSGLAIVKSPKGTGKTQALVEAIAKAQYVGRKTLVITHRIQLGRAICDRLGLDWVEDRRASETEGVFGYGICIDSVHPISQARFDPSQWEGAIVILDEVEQVVWHLLNSSTCYDKRISILETFEKLLGTVAATGGLIIAQDADISDVSVEFIRSLVQRQTNIDLKPWTCINEWLDPATCYDTYLFEGKSPAVLLNQMVAMRRAGKRFVVHTDGMKRKSKWGTNNLYKILKKKCPGVRILQINSETVADPTSPAFACVEHLNEIAAQYDIVIASPTIGTGVSLDIKGHFAAVFGIFQGVTAETETRQALARLRENVPRYIWARGYGIGKIGNGSPSYQKLVKSQERVVLKNIQLLRDFDLDLDVATDPVTLRTWAKMAARINAGIWQFREALAQGLALEGHRVRRIDSPDSEPGLDDLETEVKACRDEAELEEAIALESAPMLSENQYLELKDKRQKTESEHQQERKYVLNQRYGVDVTRDLVLKDNQRWHPQIRLHYLLTCNPEFVQQRDRQHFEQHLERGNGKIFLPDIRGRLPKVEALKVLGIERWFDPDRELSSYDDDLIEWADAIKRFASDIKDLGLGTIRQDDAPIKVLRTLLANLGMKLKKLGQRRVDGDRRRFYAWERPDDGREAIFEVWLGRDRAIAERLQSSPDVTHPETGDCHRPDYRDLNTQGCVTAPNNQQTA